MGGSAVTRGLAQLGPQSVEWPLARVLGAAEDGGAGSARRRPVRTGEPQEICDHLRSVTRAVKAPSLTQGPK